MMAQRLLSLDLSALPLFAQFTPRDGGFWMPPQRSTVAPVVDLAFSFIFWVSTFFFVLIVALMLFFVIRYRRREGVGPQPSPHHSTKLELVWSVIPLGLVIVMFYLGFTGFIEMRNAPSHSYDVRVEAQKWKWRFIYPSGLDDDNLHVPVDEPVKLTMMSKDVIHSVWIPAFRVKQDVVPGRYTTLWFRATEPGEYDLECTEYCGAEHSDMLAKVIVHPAGEFEAWLAKAAERQANLPPVERGRDLYLKRGCSACHSSDGTPKTGPSFKGIYGHAVKFVDGGEGVVDDNYIRESILVPSAKVVAGYRDQMNSYQGQLSDNDITAIIEYIKSLQ